MFGSLIGSANSIGGSALAGTGTLIEGIGAEQATKDYNAQQRKLMEEAKQWDYQRFLESRGSGGQALLPMYFPQGTETGLATDALSAYKAAQAAAGTPDTELARYQSAATGMMPAMSQSDAVVNDLFSGALTEEQVRNIQPVLAARAGVAKAQKTGILEALQTRLNALSADRSRAGYQGGGSAFQKNLLTGATVPAMQAAATVGAQADLSNASDVANIRNAGINTKLSNLNLPLTQAENRLRLITAPQATLGQTQAGRTNLLNWFKMNPQAFSWTGVPNQQLTPNMLMALGAGTTTAGQTWAATGGKGGSPPAAQQFGTGTSAGASVGPGSYSTGGYGVYTQPNTGYDWTTPEMGAALYG